MEGASSGFDEDDMGFPVDFGGMETDRKGGKSQDINFELGSDKQLKKIGSSQVFDLIAGNAEASNDDQ